MKRVNLCIQKNTKATVLMKYLPVLLILFICSKASSQLSRPAYPKDYFRNPLGIPMEIVANMGELRATHWHMGLDIRTNQKEDQPVYAAADGYITHIGIRPQSFGRYIIINHPNGFSTLYAHLNDFFPELERYVTAEQYRQESWAIELDFTTKQFPVHKSQLIAYSGNTGGSQGPHLHFEIFETSTGKRLNPLLFGFPLPDNVPPALVKLALYDRDQGMYEQSPQLYTLKNTDSGYIIPKLPVIKTGMKNISLAIQAYDRMSGSNNQDGIYSAMYWLDDQLQSGFVIDSLSYPASDYILAHIDYRYRYNGGSYLQHLSALPGEKSGLYKKFAGDGIIHLTDTGVHRIRVDVKDARFNTSQLNIAIQYSDSLAALRTRSVTPQLLAPGQPHIIRKNDFELSIPANGLYDSIRANYARGTGSGTNLVTANHQFNDPSIPVHGTVKVRIRPNREIPAAWKDKIVIQRQYRGSSNYKAAVWEQDWLSASFSDFGSFQAFADTQVPSVNELGKGDTIDLSSATRIVFTPSDNSGIKSFRAELDSQWIRFTNDKSRSWVYIFDERCPYGVHHLKVTVEDIAGNSTTREWWFRRNPYTAPPKKKVVSRKTPAKKKTTTVKKKTTTNKR